MVLENIGQDLITYWPLNESGGQRSDFVGSNNLNDINTVGSAAGKVDVSADFIPANSEALQAVNSSVHDFGDEDFMFAGWFRIDTGAATGALLSKTTNTPASQAQYQLQYISGSDRIRWIVSNDGSTSQIVIANSHGAPAKDVFLFVVCWHDSVNDTINIQINNGTVDSTVTALGINQGTAIFRIGAHADVEPSTLVTFLDGRADELAVWNRVLTSTEKSDLYNSGTGVNLIDFIPGGCIGDLCRITKDLDAYWKLEESTGTRFDFADNVNLSDNNTVDSSVAVIGSGAHLTRANSEHLDAASSSFLDFGDEDFTLACWVSLDSKPAGAQTILSKFRAGTNRQYFVDFDPGGFQRFRFLVDSNGTAGTTIVFADNFGSPPVNTLIFVVAWHDSVANTINIQINNGTVDSAAHSAGVFQGSAVFSIGSFQNSGGSAIEFINGIVDEAGVWGRLLSPAEKTALYNSGAGANIDDFFNRTSIGGYVESQGITGPSGNIGGFASAISQEEIASIGGYTQSVQLFTDSGNIGGYTQGDPFVGPTASIGGFLLAADPTIGPTGIIGGYAQSRGFLGPDGNIGGFAFSRATDEDNIFAILGGFLDVPGAGVGPVAMGGFALSLPLTTEEPVSIGGAASGLFQVQRSFGGYSFGQPDFTNFVATRGRTIVVATSENVVGQDLNIDAQIVFKAVAAGNFNAKLDNIKTSQGDVIAAVQVEKFQLPPTVFIQSVELMSASGETGPLNTLSPEGARQVCVIASGFLNDGDEFVSAHIDFADPFTNQPGTANKPFLSVSGFTGPPPWTACHDYDMSGIYKITARAQDNRGMVGMDLSGVALTSGLTAGIHYPVVSISGTPRFGEVPPSMQVNFTLVSSGLMTPPFTSKESNNSLVKSPTDDRILWQFGNRERSLKTNPFTFYQSPGLFAPKVMYKFNHPSGFGRIMVSDSLLIGFVR